MHANPVAYSVFSTVTTSMLQEPTRYDGAAWFVVEAVSGQVVMVAMHTPPQALHLPTYAPGVPRAIADHLLATGRVVPGVSGPREAAREFAARYLPATGKEVGAEEAIGVYDLPVPATLPRPVDGFVARAGATHLRLVTSWVEGFLAEIGDAVSDAERTAARQITAGHVSLWVDGGDPVAMCWASDSFGGVVRVSGVYTPSDLRGHGYASALVAAVSAAQQDAGHTCMLYTELDNPTSNNIYRAIGYRFLGDDLRLSFS